jgi:acyl dehydratase
MPITVGERASRSLTLTAEHAGKYAEISGDRNPLHFDAAFAVRTKF